jgi:hypothetical protein
VKRGARVAGWLVAPLAALGLSLLPLPAWGIDRMYSRGAYRWWQTGVTTVSNLFPFALLDVFIVVTALLMIRRVALLFSVTRTEGILTAAWEGTRRLARAGGALVLLFLLMWGLNYRRIPLDATLPHGAPPSVGELRAVIQQANAIAARSRPHGADQPSFDEVIAALREPLNHALLKVDRPPLKVAGWPKRSLILTPFFTWAGVNGMVNPLALETIVHPDLLPFERAMSLAHEWAHLSGSADEAEASAVGWLSCMDGPPTLAYSASVYLILEAGNAVPRSVWREVSATLDAGVKADLEELSRRLARQRPQVQRAAFRVYDEYLRANRVEDGVASYSRALSLILSPTLRLALDTYQPPKGAG